MATLTGLNVDVLYSQSGADLFGAFALRNITTGDTLDLSVTGVQPAFQVVRKAVIMSNGSNIAAICAFSGTVVTMPAGLAASSAYLCVTGC
jgi:hypothetical protein